MLNLNHKIPPPIIGLIAAGLAWQVSQLTPQLSFHWPNSSQLALPLALLGAIIDVWGLLAFYQAKTTINPLTPSQSTFLVMQGPYRFTRNPMYLGMACLLIAWATDLAHPLAFVSVPLFIAYITRFQIFPEERALTEKFGASYTTYLSSVRRWI